MFEYNTISENVFPTPVGVFLGPTSIFERRHSLPHARGGVSTSEPLIAADSMSSPRPWGCFRRVRIYRARGGVFPTPVGVFLLRNWYKVSLLGLPHARGGVSTTAEVDYAFSQSSPRPWGCFLIIQPGICGGRVFPTPVGVFPSVVSDTSGLYGLPHARGGVSGSIGLDTSATGSSPRPWGCFFTPSLLTNVAEVFPTPVGVFPTSTMIYRSKRCLPHARGGVSSCF